MTTTLQVYANEDDVLLFWSVPAPIPGCRGFAINRRTTDPSGAVTDAVLPNRVGFASTTPPAPDAASQTEPSTVWPFQRFSWTDHGAAPGDTLSYQVVPMVRDASGALVALTDQASEWSPPRNLSAPEGARYRAFFNRGFVISQFMARYLAENKLTPKEFKQGIDSKDEETIRAFLSGGLRPAMLDQLHTAASSTDEIYAALYELSDDELVDALTTLGPRAHLVLSNGSVNAKGMSAADARQQDENADARAKLLAASVDVGEHDRFIAPGALGHNKFLVRTDANGAPLATWTGSTNWTPTGLCTQLNNGLLIDDPQIGQTYLDQWHRLRDAASSFPKSLVDSNSSAHPGPDGSGATVWFTRTRQEVDLDALKTVIDSATQGILFLMFMPGPKGVLSYVQARQNDPGLYVRGVVSSLPNGLGDESQVDVNLVNGAQSNQSTLNIIQPEGIENSFANFAAEVTRKQFLSQIGYAIIHSKVLVIDPFSDNATVVTGSHNFSTSASAKNDENFIVITGDRALAEAYTVNIISAYEHYRWRAFLTQDPSPFNGLEDDDTWMAPKLASSAVDRAFFDHT
ncbi:phospholipase D-like domain-containing protein [Mycobacterium sp. OTB74]|uniref:phospholipase D-like domain-containing protein n=1 Tax=Mycobacterium sp. OTB74 TaxID=1853452 RepID=UPI00247E6FAA|nr:phosphatidylserine/phosphatidylglycerophosphate/cardiolipin synthase-like enzyme [Mycobacterium sp. OTB74]